MVNTRGAIFGLRRIIIKGRVIKMAIEVEETITEVTTKGIGVINSPMMPDVRTRGINDQMVVSVVDQIGTIVSLQTNKPVSLGLNLSVL